VVGQFTQYPLKLAWAITIHKSQGLTFDRMILDIGKGTFSHGSFMLRFHGVVLLMALFLKSLFPKTYSA